MQEQAEQEPEEQADTPARHHEMNTASALTWVPGCRPLPTSQCANLDVQIAAGSGRVNDAWTWAEPRGKKFAGVDTSHETGPCWTTLNADATANAYTSRR